MPFLNRLRQKGRNLRAKMQENRSNKRGVFNSLLTKRNLYKINGNQALTVSGLPVYLVVNRRTGSPIRYETANRTTLTFFQNKNAPGGMAFTSGNKLANTRTNNSNRSVYQNKNGGYFNGKGGKVWKHPNGKYRSYDPNKGPNRRPMANASPGSNAGYGYGNRTGTMAGMN